VANHRRAFDAEAMGAAMDDVNVEDQARARAVCRRFLPADRLELLPLGAGFSGARVFAVRPAAGRGADARFVCKAFADGVDETRARWIHHLMRGLRGAGVLEVPEVARTADGDTIVTDPSGIHWELIEFRAGTPTDAPTAAQAQAALQTLARLHVAAAGLVGPVMGPPPAVGRRLQIAERMIRQPWDALRCPRSRAADPDPGEVPGAALRDRLDAAVHRFATVGPRVLSWFSRVGFPRLPLQPVLRDVWAEHVLFREGGPAVGGIVDYHAAGIDTPATDLARLLGSWRPPDATGRPTDPTAWETILAAYHRLRPLSVAERAVLPVLMATGVVFGLDNWFRWLIEEKRRFHQPERVLGRIDRLLEDLPAALDFLAVQADRGGLTGGNCSL
jgi:Ser/Thr protein kinase RdoA (MazF antagonist)